MLFRLFHRPKARIMLSRLEPLTKSENLLRKSHTGHFHINGTIYALLYVVEAMPLPG